MSKFEVISEIRRRNHSANELFLAAFPAAHLADYLHRLSAMQDAPRRQGSSFVRTSACRRQ